MGLKPGILGFGTGGLQFEAHSGQMNQNASEPAAFLMGKSSFSQSRTKDLPNKRNKQSLIPVRSHQQDHRTLHTHDKNENHWPDKQGSSFFTHSGPSIDRVSSPTSSDMEGPSISSRVPKCTVSSQLEAHRDSVVTKYIDRFRYGQPLSREERQLMSSEFEQERVPLWWMSSSSLRPSFMPTKISHTDDHNQAISSPADRPLDDFNSSPCSRGDYNMNAYFPSDTSQSELEDTEILHLQERASRLLQRGDSILSSGSILVSSEGVGCSDRSSPVDMNETMQRPVINTSIKSTATMATLDSASAVPHQRYVVASLPAPPEDILSQWRLRRKMEQASEQCQSWQNSRLCTPTFRGPGPSLHFSTVNVHPYKQQSSIQYPEDSQGAFLVPKEAPGHHPSTSAPLASATCDIQVSQPHSLEHVPAHMHHLCDILPCPTQSPHAGKFYGNPHKPEETLNKEAKVSGNLKHSYIDEPPHRHIPTPPPAPSQHPDVGCPFRPRDGGNHSVPREGSSPSRHSEGGCPSRRKEIKVGDPSKPKEDDSPSRHMDEGSQSRPVNGNHPENPRMTNKTSKTEKAQAKQVGDSEKREGIIRKQNKLTRCTGCCEHADVTSATSSADQKLTKKIKKRADPQQQKRCNDTGSHAPPSALHRALGQVVSEVLFPPENSSPQDAAVPSPPAPPQSSLSSCNANTSLEVMFQLLQEAEDSDEKEFEDDPLLRVLRTQRKCVKEQISEVDSMLHNFLDKQEDTPS
ncbi:proline and serine-rich protein 3 isoform X4 [Hippocampus comes]|uniref:proline and serine-rich protein 3 isoform X4 n=1 Tax=Hippocampus comes TaxID=109280 RepID=UPI00094F38D1|nr:PREDICTED: proline and serine-rich protein 3 isoform X4 [Hippocampus comes]